MELVEDTTVIKKNKSFSHSPFLFFFFLKIMEGDDGYEIRRVLYDVLLFVESI